MTKQIKKAFTLVELIVVITILAILGTIAFISLQGYSTTARDSVRISDINNIEKTLTLFQIDAGYFPEPTGGVDITYSGGTVWTQGTIGNSVITNLKRLEKKPVDPLTSSEYTYSRLNTKNEFQVAGIYEGDELGNNNIFLNTYAAGNKTAIAYVRGNYNGIIAKVNTGSLMYILAVPTIISGDIIETNVIDLMQQNKLVYNGLSNLPSSYRNSNFNVDGGGFIFNPSNIISYTGNISDLKNYSNLQLLTINLKKSYNGSNLSTKGIYNKIMTIDLSDIFLVKSIVGNLLNNSLNTNINLSILDTDIANDITLGDDFDNDGFSDAYESAFGSDPLNSFSFPNF